MQPDSSKLPVRISVCMATYNGAEFIGMQLESILGQLEVNDEVVIADDGSTDATLDYIESFNDSRIRIIRSGGHPLGPTYNMERALVEARGEYVFLTDQDDVWLPGKVARVLGGLEKATLVLHDAYLLHRAGSTEEWIRGDLLSQIRPFARGLLRNWLKNGYTGNCMAFRRELLAKALPFPAKLPMHDQWLGLVAEKHFSVEYIPEALVEYRQHKTNATRITGSGKGVWQRIKWRVNLVKALICGPE